MSETSPMQFAHALSRTDDTETAIQEALDSIRQQMGDTPVDLLIITLSFHHAHLADAVANHVLIELNPRATIGTTAGGVIGCDSEVEAEPAIALLAAHLPGVRAHTFTYNDLNWPASSNDPYQLFNNISGPLADEGDLRLAILFADPFSVPMSKMLPAIDRATKGTPIIGGMCSGSMQPKGNRLFIDGRVLNEGAVGVALSGNIRIDTLVSQGCRPVGEPLVITDAQHNLIKTLGNRPVLDVLHDLREDLDESDLALMQEGLLIGRVINEYKQHFGRGDYLIRNVIGIAEDETYIAVSDLLKVGQTVQFHVRDRRTATEDLHLLLDAQKLYGEPAGIFLCTCNGRGEGLFEAPDHEINLIRQRLGDMPLTGMFAAGEIGPIGQRNFVHGFTAAMAMFRPAED